jgi:hypothetical protein
MKFDNADVKTCTVETLLGCVPQNDAAAAQSASPQERQAHLVLAG